MRSDDQAAPRLHPDDPGPPLGVRTDHGAEPRNFLVPLVRLLRRLAERDRQRQAVRRPDDRD